MSRGAGCAVALRIENCMDCPHHEVRRDPDPHDWFCDDDVKVVCRHSRDRPITVACRPYQIRKECDVPAWCPLTNASVEELTHEEALKRFLGGTV